VGHCTFPCLPCRLHQAEGGESFRHKSTKVNIGCVPWKEHPTEAALLLFLGMQFRFSGFRFFDQLADPCGKRWIKNSLPNLAVVLNPLVQLGALVTHVSSALARPHHVRLLTSGIVSPNPLVAARSRFDHGSVTPYYLTDFKLGHRQIQIRTQGLKYGQHPIS
jgi:hypothetical protein